MVSIQTIAAELGHFLEIIPQFYANDLTLISLQQLNITPVQVVRAVQIRQKFLQGWIAQVRIWQIINNYTYVGHL